MLHYQVVGHGDRPLLFLHGLLVSGRHLKLMARFWSGLDPRFAIVLPDLPGHGASPDLEPEASLESCAAAVERLLRDLGSSAPVPIVGHSLGGRVALQMRLSHPERVGPIQLLDVAPGPIASVEGPALLDAWRSAPRVACSAQAMQEQLEASGLSREGARWLMFNGSMSPAGFGWTQDREGFSRFYLRTRTIDLWSAVEQRQATTQVLRGELSPHVSAADQSRLQSLGAEMVSLPGCGHAMHFERPQLLAETSQRLLAPHLVD